MYTDKLDDIVKNTTYNTIEMKLINVKSSGYIDFGVENNDKDPKFKVDDHVRTSKYKTILTKSYTSFGISKVIKKKGGDKLRVKRKHKTIIRTGITCKKIS